MILSCTCRHDYQDIQYGKGRRVFNPLASQSGKPQEYRCTVCRAEKTHGAPVFVTEDLKKKED